MKKYLLFMFIFVFFPTTVKAIEPEVYNVCKNGCEYDSIQDVFSLIHNENYQDENPNEEHRDIYINIKDGETYNVDFYQLKEYYNGRESESEYVENTSASNFYLKGVDPNNKPTIYSAEGQMSFQFLNAHIISFENLIMKNIETDNSFHGGDLFIMGDCENDFVKINNCEIYTLGTFAIWSYDIEVTNSMFYSNDGVVFSGCGGTNTVNNIKVYHEGYFDLENYHRNDTDVTIVNASNIEINTISENGLSLYNDGHCNLDNIVIHGAKKYGIDIWKVKYPIYINNCDLSDNPISLFVEGNNGENEYDILINNSKINGVISKGYKKYDADSLGPIVFVDGSSTWTKEIVRSDNDEKGNVVELLDGKVIIEEKIKMTLELNDNKNKDVLIKDLFKNNLEVAFDEIEWKSSNQEIVEVINNKIFPKEVGTAIISGKYNDNIYNLEIIVVTPPTNPSTGRTFLFTFILLLVIATTLLIRRIRE